MLKHFTLRMVPAICLALTLPVYGDEPVQSFLETVDAEYLRLACDLDSGLAVFVRETVQPQRELDWWKGQMDEGSQTRIERVIRRIRQGMDQARRNVLPKDVELDFVAGSIRAPFFTTVDRIAFRGLEARATGVLSQSEILAEGFIVDPLSSNRRDTQQQNAEGPLLAVKFIGEPFQVRFDSEWVKTIDDPKERIARVMEKFPARAKVTIVWHVTTATFASLTCTEVVLTGTMSGWK